MPATCETCTSFDARAHRAEAASLVRCLHEANREGVWHRLVKAGTPACRRFTPTAAHQMETELCDLMIL
jgi:hypothetical protein